MEVVKSKPGGVLVVSLNGRLDAKTADDFEQQIIPDIEAGESKVLLDFSQLDYISSAGLRVLLMAAKKLQDRNGKIALCSLKKNIQTVFDLAGFSTIFPIFAAQAEARQALQQ